MAGLLAALEGTSAIASYLHASSGSKLHGAKNAAVVGGRASSFSRRAVSKLPESERASAIATERAAMCLSDLQQQGKCGRCALQSAYCICERLARLAAEVASLGIGQRVRFVVWMHVRERFRASNTGKLLEHILPNSEVLIHDVPADEQRFQDLVSQAAPGAAFVLFPSEDAVSATEILSDAGLSTNVESDELGRCRGEAGQVALAVLVDGTWRQARRMHKQLEALPRAILSPKALSEFHWRRQTQADRISTVEAAALLLEDLGEPPQASAALRHALAELCGALDRQSHFDTMMSGPLPPPKPLQPSHRLPKRGPCQLPGSSG